MVILQESMGPGRDNVFPGLKWPPFFANYSLMVILIGKLITEMNLDIYRVIEFIFST